jgi:hypothetical protein
MAARLRSVTAPLALCVRSCEMLVSFFKSDTNYVARLRRVLLRCVCNKLIIKELYKLKNMMPLASSS